MDADMDADSAWDRLVAESGDDVDIATMVAQSNIEDAQKALDKAKKQTPKLVGTTEEKLAAAKAFKESVVKAQNDLAKWQEIADVPKRRASLQTEQTDLQTESQGQQVADKLPTSEEVGPAETTPVEEVAQIEESAPIKEQTKGNVSTMSQETDQVSDQVEEEKDVVEELRERNRVGNERDQRAGIPPRPSDYIEAIGKGDDKAMKAWEGEFNDYAQKLNADDLPDIESTIRQMQGHIDTIRSGNPKGYKDNSAYKAYSGIKKMLEKRRRELSKQTSESNTRLSAMSGVGLMEDARTRTLGDKTRKMLDAMAKRLGLQVEFVDEIVTGKDEKGRNTYANADIVGNKVRIAWDKRDQALDFLLGHEFTHRMQNLSPEAYAEFVEATKQALGEKEWNKRINRMKSLYKQHGIAISEQGIIDEVVADYAGELVEERGVFDNFVERNKDNRSLLSAIADVLRSIKEFFTLGKQRKINNAIARLEALIESASEANVDKVDKAITKAIDSIAKVRYSLSTGNIEQDNQLGKALYTINKEAKRVRDLKSEVYNQGLTDDVLKEIQSLGGISKSFNIENGGVWIETSNGGRFRDLSDVKSSIHESVSEISELESKLQDADLEEDEKADIENDLEFEEEYLDELRDIESAFEEYDAIDKYDAFSLFNERIDELYAIKEGVLNELIANGSPDGIHSFPSGDIRRVYKLGDYSFHGKDISDETLSEEEQNSIEDLEEISSENKLDDKISVEEALNILSEYTPQKARYSLIGEQDIEAINKQFNEELQQQIDGTLPNGHVYELGMPSDILLSIGFPYMPIELVASKLLEKSKQEDHPFDLEEVEDLVINIQKPMAIFRSATHIGSYVVLTEIEHGGKNFVVAIKINKRARNIRVNDIRSVHYRSSNIHFVNWIEDELLEYVDKEKMSEWLSKQQYHSAEVRKRIRHVAKIINEFENPTISEEKNEENSVKAQYSLQGNSMTEEVESVLEDYTLNKDNVGDFEYALMQSIAGQSYSARPDYKVLDGVVVRVKGHTPDWDNFVNWETDKAESEKILNVTVGNYEDTDYRRNKEDYESFVEAHPETTAVNVDIEDGTSLADALSQIHEALKAKGIDFEFAPDYSWTKWSEYTPEARYSLASDMARDAVMTALEGVGIDVEMATPEMVEDVLRARDAEFMSAKKRRALETVSSQDEYQQTVVSSADGAKVLKNLDSLAKEYQENTVTHEKTFLGKVAEAIGAKKYGSNSQYATFETVNGKIVTIRLADHNATVSNFDIKNESEGISIVVSAKKSEGIYNDGGAHIVEYYYDAIKLRKAEGKPLADIVKSIKQALYSGVFNDSTGLAEYQEVNIPEFHIAYHGSGAKFDEFDHSHMGEGEGAQAYGWGTYLTEVEGVAKMYAGANGATMLTYKGNELDTDGLLNQWRVIKDLYDENKGRLREMRNRAERILSLVEEDNTEMKQLWQSVVDTLKQVRAGDLKVKPKRNLYTVEIPDDNGSNYLDYDEEMSKKEINEVRNKLEAILAEGDYKGVEKELKRELDSVFVDGLTASDVYGNVSAYLGGDKQASEFFNEMGCVGIKYPANYRSGGNEDGKKNFVIFNDSDMKITDRVEFLQTPDGTVYGWTIGGKIFLTEQGMNAETPIHEYTHLWANAMRRNNEQGWESVKDLLRGTPMWDEVLADKNYSNIHDNEDLVASEVLSRYSGKDNAKRLEDEAQRMISEAKGIGAKADAVSLIDRVRRALQKFWDWVGKDLFGIKDFDSIEQVTDRVLYDLMNQTDLNAEVSEGEGPFGKIYRQFKGKAKEAFDYLMKVKEGDALGVYNRKGIGDIDLVWGDKNGGLAHIISKHIGKGKSFANIEDAQNSISDIINNGGVIFENGDKVVISKNGKIVTLRKNFRVKGKKIADKNWILTAYNENAADNTSAISGINQGQAAPTTAISADKGNANSSDVQAKSGKGAKFSLQGGRSIADKYEKKVNTKGKGGAMHLSKFNFMEAWQDEMRALKEVQRIIEQEYDIVLESYEDAYMAENAMSSIAKASWDRYINEVYEPMMRIHDEWIRSGESNESINHYLIAKSGLERNREFTVRDALRAERASMEESIRDAYRSAIKDLNEKYKPMELDLLNQYRSGAIDKDTYRNERKNLSDAKKAERKPIDDKYQLDMQDVHDKMTQVEEEYKAKRNALRDDLKAGNIDFAEFCRLSDDLALQYSGAEEIADYSGLTALAKIYGRDYFYNFAMGMVDAFERRHSNTDVMWEHINNNTKAAVDYSYKSGITSKQAKEHLDQMFVWYVPMKGNADVEAEDIYTYVNDKSSSFTPTVARAKGHTKYVSEDVMALIANTMQSAILQGERNKVKQKFLNMVQNYPTDLFSVDNGWVELQGNDWVEVFPDINENDTPEEVRSVLPHQFYNLQIFYILLIDYKTNNRSLIMPTLLPGCSRIYVQ